MIGLVLMLLPLLPASRLFPGYSRREFSWTSGFRSLGDGKQGSAGLMEGDRSLEADSGKKPIERAVQEALDQESIHKVKNLLRTNEVPWVSEDPMNSLRQRIVCVPSRKSDKNFITSTPKHHVSGYQRQNYPCITDYTNPSTQI